MDKAVFVLCFAVGGFFLGTMLEMYAKPTLECPNKPSQKLVSQFNEKSGGVRCFYARDVTGLALNEWRAK